MITLLNGSGSGSTETTQWLTDDATTYAASRFTPGEKESGHLLIRYNAVNPLTGAAADRVKVARYKKVSGTVTIVNTTVIYGNADTGMTTAEITVTASAGEVLVNLTGIAATSIRHTMTIDKTSSALR